jgi:8-oxo-dGTP diphosphatase
MKFNYCPLCATPLTDKDGLMQCWEGCRKYTHYDNPVPVVSCLIPYTTDHPAVVVVQRGVDPFKGEWCLPCGFINKGETPKAAAAREALEETSLVVRHEKLLSACAPSMSEMEDSRLNVLVIFYMSRAVGGRLMRGDDAIDAKVFHKGNIPKLCFRSHQMIVDEFFKGTWGQLTGVDL